MEISTPELNEGERYAGIALNEDGSPSHHLILLSAETELPWTEAIDWAKEQGGELPTRQEQSLLFANCKQHFKPDWYWSSEEYAPNTKYAWVQSFGNGDQDCNLKSLDYRARAVRRLPI